MLMIINVTTAEMPFELILEGNENRIRIDESIKDSLNSKTRSFKGRDDLSMMEVYRLARLTDRELWELCKIKTEFNRQNMSFENMFPGVDALQTSILTYYSEYSKRINIHME